MNNWQIKKLGDVAQFKNGKKPQFSELGIYPVYGANGSYGFSENVNAEYGHIVIGRVGAYCGSIYYLKEKAWITDNAIMCTPKENTSFLYYFLTLSDLNNKAHGAAQPLLNQEILSNIDILLPPLSEQRAIAGVLVALDDKIEANRKENETLEAMAQALFKSWFVNFEPFGGTMPNDWEIGKLIKVLDSIKQPIRAGDNVNLPYVPIDTIPIHELTFADYRPNKEAQSSLIKFNKNDILIGAMRVYFHRVSIAPFDGITRTTCFVLRPKQKEYLEYALLLCNLDSTIDYASTTSKGSTMPYAIWEGGLSELQFPIPSLSDAQKFSDIAKPLISKMIDNSIQSRTLAQIRDLLLPRLMSGKIRVPTLNCHCEPAGQSNPVKKGAI